MILREEPLALVVQASLLCNVQIMRIMMIIMMRMMIRMMMMTMRMMMMRRMVLILMNYLYYNDKNHKKAKQF